MGIHNYGLEVQAVVGVNSLPLMGIHNFILFDPNVIVRIRLITPHGDS